MEDIWGTAPRDVLFSIFKHLPVTDLIRRASLINRKWSKIARSNAVWSDRLQLMFQHPQFKAVIEAGKFVNDAVENGDDIDDIYAPEIQDYLLDIFLLNKALNMFVSDVFKSRQKLSDTFFYREFIRLWADFGHIHIWRDPETKKFVEFRSWHDADAEEFAIAETPVVVLVDEGDGQFSVKQNPTNVFTKEEQEDLEAKLKSSWKMAQISVVPSGLVALAGLVFYKSAEIVPELYNAAIFMLSNPRASEILSALTSSPVTDYWAFAAASLIGVAPFLVYTMSLEWKQWTNKHHKVVEEWYERFDRHYCVVVINKAEDTILYVRSKYSTKEGGPIEPVWVHDKGVDLLGDEIKCASCGANAASFACGECGEHFYCDGQCQDHAWENGHKFECGLK